VVITSTEKSKIFDHFAMFNISVRIYRVTTVVTYRWCLFYYLKQGQEMMVY
jgi:hypothetical protein